MIPQNETKIMVEASKEISQLAISVATEIVELIRHMPPGSKVPAGATFCAEVRVFVQDGVVVQSRLREREQFSDRLLFFIAPQLRQDAVILQRGGVADGLLAGGDVLQ